MALKSTFVPSIVLKQKDIFTFEMSIPIWPYLIRQRPIKSSASVRSQHYLKVNLLALVLSNLLHQSRRKITPYHVRHTRYNDLSFHNEQNTISHSTIVTSSVGLYKPTLEMRKLGWTDQNIKLNMRVVISKYGEICKACKTHSPQNRQL